MVGSASDSENGVVDFLEPFGERQVDQEFKGLLPSGHILDMYVAAKRHGSDFYRLTEGLAEDNLRLYGLAEAIMLNSARAFN